MLLWPGISIKKAISRSNRLIGSSVKRSSEEVPRVERNGMQMGEELLWHELTLECWNGVTLALDREVEDEQ